MLHLEFLARALSGQHRSSSGTSGERGASLVEYALLVVLIAVVCIGAVAFFGGELNSSFSTTGESVN